MNYLLLDLTSIGLVNYNARKWIHDQTLFEALYKCADTGIMIGFMYASPYVPSNINGVDEVCIYLKEKELESIVIPVEDLNYETISDSLDKLGYHAAKVKYRKLKINAILDDLNN